ncbi:MAG: hypothetical protein COT24_01205 [Candidatus Kerfeldbacteria bacterium CG08_land_8_20_14_0_20_40_16]|uniref:dolichyl-phosphate beta-glucosyltransferase n=1 Tax=Candidatus Kerfeldbacteria bacterium CG08_land_8_20_14_0_20_40_16 TaxID=2014244 RepID=A0A2H0YX62_9BACT|nr:MAG: hypothetical protein COT24_01205 [Candidatus Kerfeldbacteria bacterium CG08_land_8_20_14_0_20_40_16]
MNKRCFFPPISLVIPVYNEEKRIRKSLAEILPYLNHTLPDYEIIFVDDGSTDQTLPILEQYQNEHFQIIKNDRNYGKGYSVKQGMLKARFTVVLFSDADFSTPIEDLEKLLPYLKEYDIVIGSRGMKESQVSVHQPFYKEWLGKLGNKFIQLLIVPGIKDTQCGFKMFKKETLIIFRKQTIERWGFDFEILMLAKRMGFKIKEVPVKWRNDFRSKVRFFDYLKTLGELLKIKWNILTNKYDLKNHGR